MKHTKNVNHTTGNVIKGFINTLISRLKHGEYTNSIPPNKYKKLGRNRRAWDLLEASEKGTYLKLMELLTRDDLTTDHHIGDDNFRNAIIGGIDEYIKLTKEICSKEYLNDKTIEFPDKLLADMNKSSSTFNYAEYISKSIKAYMNVSIDREHTRNRRYKAGTDIPMVMPLDEDAVLRFFKMWDQWAEGAKWMIEQSDEEQDTLIIQALVKGTNIGWPAFFKGTATNIPKTLISVMNRVGFKINTKIHSSLNRPCITWELIRSFRAFITKNKIRLPFLGFSRNSKGKLRVVCGAHVLQKFEAAGIKVIFTYANYYKKHEDSFLDYSNVRYDPETGAVSTKPKGLDPLRETIEAADVLKTEKATDLKDQINKQAYAKVKAALDVDDPNPSDETKELFGYGGVPLVAKLNWEDMFQMFVNRLPNRSCKVHIKWVENTFHYKVPDKYIVDGEFTYVNVLCGDFSGFDTGQIPEEYKDMFKHKYFGSWFRDTAWELANAPVWSGMIEFYDIFFKSGFWGTSDWGSFFHHGTACYAVKRLGGVVIAHTCLSDDDIMWVLSNKIIHAEDLSKVYAEFGHTIKASASHDWALNPVVGFLKMHMGYIFNDNQLTLLGDIQSRLYGMLHSERDTKDATIGDLRNVWNITGDVEIDRFLSKLASGGPAFKPWVALILRLVKGTVLGDASRMAIMNASPDKVYKPYRDDFDSLYPPNWMFKQHLVDNNSWGTPVSA